jgi:hypothetical protein
MLNSLEGISTTSSFTGESLFKASSLSLLKAF